MRHAQKQGRKVLSTFMNDRKPRKIPRCKTALTFETRAQIMLVPHFFIFYFLFFFYFVRPRSDHRRISRWTAGCAVLKSAPSSSGREELNRRHARALSVSFERPLSPSWTSPQLTTSAFLESSSLCHVLCECHNKAGVGTNVDIRSSNSFLVQRICLHSDTHRQSHWKWSCDHTADSFSQSPMLSATRSPKQASEGAQNQTPK